MFFKFHGSVWRLSEDSIIKKYFICWETQYTGTYTLVWSKNISLSTLINTKHQFFPQTYFLRNLSQARSEALVQDQLLIVIPAPKKANIWNSYATRFGRLDNSQVMDESLKTLCIAEAFPWQLKSWIFNDK